MSLTAFFLSSVKLLAAVTPVNTRLFVAFMEPGIVSTTSVVSKDILLTSKVIGSKLDVSLRVSTVNHQSELTLPQIRQYGYCLNTSHTQLDSDSIV